MGEQPRVGVYVCHCGNNIAGIINVEEVADYASKLPGVTVSRTNEHVCSDTGQDMIIKDIKELNLNRVVVAACTPRMHELTFQETIKKAGLNPHLLEIANIREQCSWIHEDSPGPATEKAKEIVKMSVSKARLLKPIPVRTIEVAKSTLVIGGGIAGIQAALDLADAGYKVYLLEKSPSIGGRMAQWGKVFPTLDCSACILTPKMTTAAHHPNITLLTYSEIKGVTGSIGNFEVKIEKKPRYINIKKCTGCGVCAQKCPVRVPNEFDFGISSRKAVYIPFSQAVPAIYTIDKDQCLYFTKGICQVCKKFCSANAIEFDQKPEEITVKVGTIIVATGFDPFDPTVIEQYGYKLYKNVITGPIIERMASAFGPTSGKIVRPSDNREPKKVAFLTCVGSRDAKLNLRYCSRVCCMYTMKAALLLKEQNPGIEVHIIYMDIRAFGKGYEEFYVRTQEKGVRFIRGKVSSISEDKTTKDLILRYEDTLLGKIMEERYDLVVLAVGQVPRQDAEVIGRLLNIPKGIDGFFMEAHVKLRPHDTPTDGIYLAGSCQYPKDIADTVSQASGAAARAAIPMSRGVVEVEAAIPSVIKEKCGGCRICEAVCPFNAIEMKKEKDKLIASINEALCKGCGACSAACPATALEMGYLTDEQILAQVDCVAY